MALDTFTYEHQRDAASVEQGAAEDEQRAQLDDLPSTYVPPQGRMRTHLTGTRAQHDLLREWIQPISDEQRDATLRFLIHVLACMPGALRRDDRPKRWLGYVPVGSLLIRKEARGADWKTLQEDGVLLVRPYDRIEPKSREFRVSPEHWRAFLEAGHAAHVGSDGRTLDARGEASRKGIGERVSFRTGNTSVRQERSTRTTESRHALPPMVRDAMDAIGPSPFNPVAIGEHLDRLRHSADALPDGKERQRALARYLNDLACFEAVLRQSAAPLDDYDVPTADEGQTEGVRQPKDARPVEAGILWDYHPAYRMGYTGRIAQKGGGLQSCSCAMKTAAYTDVTDLLNLDLKSSQARILIVLMEEAGIESTWLRDYGERADAKHVAAECVGVAVDTWKGCLYALLMSANTPGPNQVSYSEGAIVTSILDDVGYAAFDDAYGRFLHYTAELRDDLGRWHDHLVTDYIARHGRLNNADGKTYLKNEVGAPVSVEHLAGGGATYTLKARLAAFLLQGREAAFTHTLVASSAKYGFHVVSHEHDGVVVIGSVPEAAVDAAAARARLPRDLVDLVEKSFE